MKQKQVCVIGAGIAGLVTAKILREDGFAVTVFEKQPGIGGVWESSRTYPGLRANNSRFSYSFSDFPYPSDADEFPTATQIRDYLTSYARHFGLLPDIHLSTAVQRISRSAQGEGFDVTISSLDPAAIPETRRFDFVAVCNGVFSEPEIPSIEGAESFSGRLIHSSRLRFPEEVAGKRVIVVGAAKSGLDCATLAAHHAASATLLFRRAHWMMPRHLPNGLRGEQVFFNRAVAALTVYHRQSRAGRWFHKLCAPLVRGFWNLQGKLLIDQAGVPPHMVPKYPLPGGLVFAGAGTDFFDALKAGKLVARCGAIRRFCGGDTLEVAFPDGAVERLSADVVVLATGWRQPLDFLSPDLAALVRPAGCFRLYRRILPPAVPGLGFIGYASSTACQLSSEMAAHWLSDCFLGRLELPPVARMEAEIDHVQRWTSSALAGRDAGFFIGGYLIQYIDELLEDMRVSRRRLKNPVHEFFAPLDPGRWSKVSAERRQSRR